MVRKGKERSSSRIKTAVGEGEGEDGIEYKIQMKVSQ
jgi:hypothetical protein